jgi:hypothetical protein
MSWIDLEVVVELQKERPGTSSEFLCDADSHSDGSIAAAVSNGN